MQRLRVLSKASRACSWCIREASSRSRQERDAVSKKQKQALKRIARNIKKNSPIIRRKLIQAGVKPDPVLVFFAAKYYGALKKLAKA